MSINNHTSDLRNKLEISGALSKLLSQYKHNKISPILGYEIEFYLPLKNIQIVEKEIGTSLHKEEGALQYEINRGPFSSPQELIEAIEFDRKILMKNGADLRSKPFARDYGNSMHLHLNIKSDCGKNLFDDQNILQHAASGICHHINQTILAILQTEEDYLRLDEKFMAPAHICYGNNNRTVAVRVPDCRPKRIEYRVPSSSSDALLAVFIVLKSSLTGIINNYQNYTQIFGNAFEEQYGLKPIARSLEEAKQMFNPNFFLVE